MKTLPILASIASLAALAAFVLLPLSFEMTCSLLFGAGLAAIVYSDYARVIRSGQMQYATAAVPAKRSERFGLAA